MARAFGVRPLSGDGNSGGETTSDAAARQGRDAASPWAIPSGGWKAALSRTWNEASADNLGLVAAGVGFYVFLALVPLLAAIVLTYGLLAQPETVVRNISALSQLLPADAAKLIGDQLMNVVSRSGGEKGLGLLAALGIALFGARNAAGGIISALNIVYEEDEKRGFIAVNLLALGMTAGAVIGFIAVLVAIAALGFLESLLPQMAGIGALVVKVAVYLLLAAGATGAAAVLYRYGPSRDDARWRWLSPGSLLFTSAWILLTLGFGIYVANFGNYGATYGSLSAVVVLLTWLYLSAYALLFGAELNSELEHQTARDTTTGPAEPMGQRQAWAADHVAAGPQDAGEERDESDPASRAQRRARMNRQLERQNRPG